MTREEAIKKHYKIKCHIEESKKILNLINEIYDSFENRSCKNCKYSTLDSARYLPIHKCLVGCNGVDYDFYCNKWEQK